MQGRRWSTFVFLAGILLVFGALGWVTYHALRLERAEQEAVAEAKYQENIRLALWRMDSAIAPVLAREAARPYFEYRSFYPADRAYTRTLQAVDKGEVLVPSPLIQETDPYVRLHFERSSTGAISSPQVPEGHLRELADGAYTTGYDLASSEQTLARLSDLLFPKEKSLAPAAKSGGRQEPVPTDRQSQETQQLGYLDYQKPMQQQIQQNDREYEERARNASNITKNSQQRAQLAASPQNGPKPETASNDADGSDAGKQAARSSGVAPGASPKADTAPPSPDSSRESRTDDSFARKAPSQTAGSATAGVPAKEKSGSLSGAVESDAKDEVKKRETEREREPVLVGVSDAGVVQREFSPLWIISTAGDRELLYTREVDAGRTHLTQGFWIDWPALSTTLIDSVQDLLPGAQLRPLPEAPSPANITVRARSLASLPAELVALRPPLILAEVWSPVRSTLFATWIAALGAVLAIALVLRASMELAERRGRFVSAVTHELRTPLTTFCLYSQMLADGMVTSEESRRTYIKTLNTESTRLARIVESVLDYARLGRPKSFTKTNVSALDLLARVEPPLRSRCEQAGMTLIVEQPHALDATIWCDPPQVERILFNLVDNACKYASGSEDTRVHLTLTASPKDLVFTVKDHGPGVERQEHARVFRPFFRGHKQADGSTPGLGLGLALSKGLAHELGGELRLMPTDNGAEFRLRLPR